MAYTTGTLVPCAAGFLESNTQVWLYVTTDADATIVGAGYVSDATKRRMKVGDLVDAINLTGPKYKRYQVASISAGAATLQAPSAIT